MPETVDLELLDAFLLSDRAPDNGMGLSDLDGFLSGLVVGPETILPSEWLPYVWGVGISADEALLAARRADPDAASSRTGDPAGHSARSTSL